MQPTNFKLNGSRENRVVNNSKKTCGFWCFFCLGDLLSREENWDFGAILDVPSAHRFDATHWQLAILGVDEKGCPREAVCWAYTLGLQNCKQGKEKTMCGRWQASRAPIDSDYGVFFNFIAWKGQFFQWRKWQNNIYNIKHLFSTGHLHYLVVSYFDQKTEQQDIIKHNQWISMILEPLLWSVRVLATSRLKFVLVGWCWMWRGGGGRAEQ